jgi:hypothetical protein
MPIVEPEVTFTRRTRKARSASSRQPS